MIVSIHDLWLHNLVFHTPVQEIAVMLGCQPPLNAKEEEQAAVVEEEVLLQSKAFITAPPIDDRPYRFSLKTKIQK